MLKLLYNLLFIMLSNLCVAQMITAKIIIDDPIEGYDQLHDIQIENITSNAKTKSSNSGLFSIKVNENDELIISSEWTQLRQLKITKELISKGFFEVHLNINLIQLEAVNLHTVSKNLKDNVKKSDDEIINLYKNLGINPKLRDIKVNPYSSSLTNDNGILDPARWIGSLTGQRKQQQKQDQYFDNVKKIEAVIANISTDYFTQFLRIPTHKINEFVQYVINTKDLQTHLDAGRYSILKEEFTKEAPNYLDLIKAELE